MIGLDGTGAMKKTNSPKSRSSSLGRGKPSLIVVNSTAPGEKIESWRHRYDREHPQSALDYLCPESSLAYWSGKARPLIRC